MVGVKVGASDGDMVGVKVGASVSTIIALPMRGRMVIGNESVRTRPRSIENPIHKSN